MTDKIRIDGIRQFQKQLRDMDSALPKTVRLVLNEATALVIKEAEPHIPKRSGAARASIKARSSQREARVAVGGRRAPWYPWLDFGGQGKRSGRPGARPFLRKGRYLYPALDVKRGDVITAMAAGLAQLAHDAGLDVT